MTRRGAKQGAHAIDRPTTPTVRANVVYANGKERPGIAVANGGSDASPVVIAENVVFDSGSVGIGVSRGTVAVVEANRIRGARLAGIAVNGATLRRLNENAIEDTQGAGLTIVNGARVLEMRGNAVHATKGPAYVLQGSTVR